MRARAALEINTAVQSTEEHSTGRKCFRAPVARERLTMLFDNRATANAVTLDFFQNTKASALRSLIRQSTFTYFDLILHACSKHTRYQLAIVGSLHPVILYLPLHELEPMVNSLCQLELYRDHKALLSLVDALTIRLFEHPEIESEQITLPALREKLLNRAIDFHQHHNRVLPTLEAAKLQLASPLPTFLNNDDEPIVVSISPKKGFTQHSDVLVRKKTLASSSQVGLFASAQTQPKGGRGNSHLEYEAEDIQVLFSLRTQSFPNVAILAAAHMNEGVMGNRVSDIVNNYVESQQGIIDLKLKHKLVIPIAIGHHWVGIQLHLTAESTLITFYNSSRNQAIDQPLMSKILDEVRSIHYEGQRVFKKARISIQERCLQQDDDVSCGVLLVENIYCDLKRSWYPPEASIGSLVQGIRRCHLDLLSQFDPAYYQGFSQRQKGEDINHSEMMQISSLQ